MNKINSIFKILLSLHYIDGFLGDIYRNLYSLKMHGFVPRLDCQGHSKVAVFAPHPDDEVIGAMGAIYGHRMAKSDICMIFCTPKKVDAMRRKEAERASKIMDVRTHFLGWEERFFPELTEAAEDICTILSTEKPDIIYIPSPVDPNPDHVLLNRILYYIWNADLIPRPMEIRLYGVLAPIPIEVATGGTDLAPYWDKKKYILYEVYESQTKILDFRNILIIQRMLGIHLGTKAAELYFMPSINGWLQMMNAIIHLGRPSVIDPEKCYFSWRRPVSKFRNVSDIYKTVLHNIGNGNLYHYS